MDWRPASEPPPYQNHRVFLTLLDGPRLALGVYDQFSGWWYTYGDRPDFLDGVKFWTVADPPQELWVPLLPPAKKVDQ